MLIKLTNPALLARTAGDEMFPQQRSAPVIVHGSDGCLAKETLSLAQQLSVDAGPGRKQDSDRGYRQDVRHQDSDQGYRQDARNQDSDQGY